MHIHCLGLNHQTADLDIRERLAFSDESARAALSRLGCGLDTQPDSITEMVILSTCNRVEIYALAPHPDFTSLENFLAEVQGVPVEHFRRHLYEYLDGKAVEHLFRVAAGLDSLVLGEPQILGQVMNAFEIARGRNAVGPVLSRLFQAALHTGKRARTETSISHNPASIASVAIHLAGQVVQDLQSSRVGVVGAGEMAELAVEALRKRGAADIRVVNRTLEKARRLAERWDGKAYTFEQLPQVISEVDVLITSTSAPHTVIRKDMIVSALASRSGRPLVMVDIAVPRDVDLEVAGLPGVSLYDLDTLHEHLEYSLASRAGEIPHVEAILCEEEDNFMGYMKTLDVVPIIAEMRQQAEVVRLAELEKTLRRLPDLTDEERQRLEAMTLAMVKKILHHPIMRLRSQAGSPKAAECAAAARSLFGLDANNGSKYAAKARRNHPDHYAQFLDTIE